MLVEAVPAMSLARLRDIIALGKPRLSSLVICTTAGGMWLAPGALVWPYALAMLAATATLVWAANAVNCYIEREHDARMVRTASRPLAAGRLDARAALAAAIAAALVSLAVIALSANPLTAALGALAFVSYVSAYTPLKRHSSLALLVGAVPGALPPLMGWTSVTGRADAGGLVLAAILFFWQLPHFIAISLYLREDYARGGFKVFSIAVGERAAKVALVASTVLLVPVTLLLVPLDIGGPIYGVSASVLGVGFVVISAWGLRAGSGLRWARGAFMASLAYLTLLFAALAAGAT